MYRVASVDPSKIRSHGKCHTAKKLTLAHFQRATDTKAFQQTFVKAKLVGMASEQLQSTGNSHDICAMVGKHRLGLGLVGLAVDPSSLDVGQPL